MAQGWGRPAGTLVRALLQGYISKLQEEEDRKARELYAQGLGVTLPQQEERSYLSRVLTPNVWKKSAEEQMTLMKALQEQRIRDELEQSKQSYMLERQQAVEGTRAKSARELAEYKMTTVPETEKFKADASMERLRTGRALPQALDPSTVSLNRARVAELGQRVSTARTLEQIMRNAGFGGAALQQDGSIGMPGAPTLAPPAPSTPTPSAPAAHAPTQPGQAGQAGRWEMPPPTVGMRYGGMSMSMTPRETPTAEAAREAEVTRQRELVKKEMQEIPVNVLITRMKNLSAQLNTEQTKPAQVLKTGKQVLGNVTGGLLESIGLPYSETLSNYQGAVESYVSVLQKSVAGESGVLTNQDIQRGRNAVASIWNTKGEAKFKWDVLEELGNIAQRRDLDPHTQAAIIRQKLDEIEQPDSPAALPAHPMPGGETDEQRLQRLLSK